MSETERRASIRVNPGTVAITDEQIEEWRAAGQFDLDPSEIDIEGLTDDESPPTPTG